MGHLKKKMKLGPLHFPIHQWKSAGKEKRGGGEKEGSVRKGNTSKLSVRNFVIVFLSLTQVEAS